ncbi:class I SAM-dependent methyltransferase [Candidatus Dependentiae bacterium]|nr:class I SAM-dependent methyltransferase [Candidatus Dependentiae bacterium]
MKTINDEIIELEDNLRTGFLKYTRQAFGVLPKLNEPLILDIGCGSGIPAIELTNLCNGKIIGVDINQESLDRFEYKISKANLHEKIEIRKLNIFNLNFPPENFDIIWAEGSIAPIGFEKGLNEWKSFIKPNGFLVVHDSCEDFKQKLKAIPACGYTLLNHFIISHLVWWSDYFEKLEKKIKQLKNQIKSDDKGLKIIKIKEKDIESFKNNLEDNSSVFFIMKK